jgi:hypothetical protein
MSYLSIYFCSTLYVFKFLTVATKTGFSGLAWANYRRQADIGFFKNFDFMIDMASFNV